MPCFTGNFGVVRGQRRRSSTGAALSFQLDVWGSILLSSHSLHLLCIDVSPFAVPLQDARQELMQLFDESVGMTGRLLSHTHTQTDLVSNQRPVIMLS